MSDEKTQDPQAEAVEEKQPEVETPETPAEPAAEIPAQEPAPAAEEKKEEVTAPAEEAPKAEEAAPAPEAPAEEAPAEEAAPVEEKTDEGKVYLEKLDNLEELKPGQTVRVHEKIHDISPKGEKRERIQVFEGMILGLRGGGISRTMTVRKLSGGVAVEKIYPINSPVVAKVELVKTARVRRAKLNFLKNLKRRFKRKLKETHVETAKGKKKKK